MIARLDDPWFEAKFITKTVKRSYQRHDKLDGADGIVFWCPCGYGKSEFPLEGDRPHSILISFANPINASIVSPDSGSQTRFGKPSRWIVGGTGFDDLSLSPSIDNDCWHGYIMNGVIL